MATASELSLSSGKVEEESGGQEAAEGQAVTVEGEDQPAQPVEAETTEMDTQSPDPSPGVDELPPNSSTSCQDLLPSPPVPPLPSPPPQPSDDGDGMPSFLTALNLKPRASTEATPHEGT